MDKNEIKNTVQLLRRKGFTFQEIERTIKIAIPKSTLSMWCKNIKMPNFYYKKVKELNRINLATGRKIGRQKREKQFKNFLKGIKSKNRSLVKKFDKDIDVKKIALAILYLGEGAKWKGHRGLTLGSSDPIIIKLYIKLLKNVYRIPQSSLRARVSHRADQNLKNLLTFWSKITGLNRDQFYKSKPDPRTIGKPTKNKGYKGVCVISCAGTKIQLELEEIPKMF
ncbi:MAG: hypothetical protein WC297_01615 [Candidatus Paceibacterota bacterium]|jgi:hypothetical protein